MPKKITATVGSEERIIVDRFQIDPANFTLSSLPDTSITSPVNGNFLSYYNNNWVNVDAPTARTNLGLGTAATTAASAYATAAQGTLAASALQATSTLNADKMTTGTLSGGTY